MQATEVGLAASGRAVPIVLHLFFPWFGSSRASSKKETHPAML